MSDGQSGESENSVSKLRLAAFSATNYGKGLVWTLADVFFLVFATDTLGINPALAGALVLATLIWDAVTDPVVGALIDRSDFLSRRHGRTLVLAAPLMAIFLSVTFAVQILDGALAVIGFFVGMMLFRTGFTFSDIPDNALFARIARTRAERLFSASARKTMATVAALTVTISTAWVFDEGGVWTEGSRILVVVLLAAPLAVGSILLGAHAVRSHDRRQRLDRRVHTLRDLARSARHPAARRLIAHVFCSTLGIAIFGASLVYFSRFVLGDASWFATAMSVFFLAQAAGVFAWSAFAIELEERLCLCAAAGLAGIAATVFVFSSGPVTLLVAVGLFGFAAGGLNTLRWSLTPWVIDQIEEDTSFRLEALLVALLSLTIKSAIGVSALLLGGMLALSGYEAGAVATPLVASSFVLMVAGVCVCMLILSTWPIWRVRSRMKVRAWR